MKHEYRKVACYDRMTVPHEVIAMRNWHAKNDDKSILHEIEENG